MSFLDEIKKEYQEASTLTDDIKEDIKTQIKKAVREGVDCVTVDINTISVDVTKKAGEYAEKELGLEVSHTLCAGLFRVTGWS
jgi:hypothetical protein